MLAKACRFRVLCNILLMIIVIEKLDFWDEAFFAVLEIEVHPDYIHVHMCRHN